MSGYGRAVRYNVLHAATALQAAKSPTSDPPCATRYQVLINRKAHLALAKKYGL